MRLTASAVITGSRLPLPDRWVSAAGIEVHLEAGDDDRTALATLIWPDAPDESAETQKRFRNELEDRLRLDTLERLSRTHIEWQPQGGSFVSGTGWVTQGPALPLSGLVTLTPALVARPAARDSIDLLREALELWFVNNRAALSRLFIAGEGIVIAVTGKFHAAAWARTADRLNLTTFDGERLYYSLQHARHADVNRSEKWFAAHNEKRLEPWDCVAAVRRVVQAYLVNQDGRLVPVSTRSRTAPRARGSSRSPRLR